jgi:CRP-like cAMP-binding protein
VSQGDDPGGVPVLKVGLRRLDPVEWVLSDEALRQCALVRLLGEGLAAQLLAAGVGRRFKDRSAVFRAGEQGESLFLIVRGQARLVCTSDKEELEIGVAHKGELLGEGEALERGARAHSAFASGDLEVVELHRVAVEEAAQHAAALRTHLQDVAKARTAARQELAAFLDRW